MKNLWQTAAVIFGVIAVIISISTFWQPEADVAEQDKSLRFSTTQTWKPELRALVDTQSWATDFTPTLPPPPANDSEETKSELLYLHALIHDRTPEKVTEIETEINLQTGWLDTVLYPTSLFPYTRFLFSEIHETLGPIVMREKHRFDRVRPSYLDPTLSTAITVPEHPSYPSGHATQAHLYAHILSTLDPENSAEYFERAASIAKNREYAGVHYPSDSEAGKLLAAQLYDYLLADEYFQTLLRNAQTEWERR